MKKLSKLCCLLLVLMTIFAVCSAPALAAHTEASRGEHPNHDACGAYSVTTFGICRCGKICACYYGYCRVSLSKPEHCTVHGGNCGENICTEADIYNPQAIVRAKPTKVTLSESGTVTMAVGDVIRLTAQVTPSGADAALTWSSSKKSVVSVYNGIVGAFKEGSATITVKTSNGKKDTVKIKVVDPYKPTGVNIDRSGTVTLSLYDTLDLNALLEPASARSTLKWSSSSKSRATVDANGVVKPLKEGTVTITVKTANGKKDTVKVKIVDPFKPTGVNIDRSGTVTLSLYDTLDLNALLEPASARSTLKWSSSSKSRATVDANGVVKPLKEGTVTITVKTHNGKKDTVKVKIVDPFKPTGVNIDRSGTVILSLYETLDLNTTLEPASARSTLKWSSSSKSRATVDANGVVKPLKEGTVTITVKTHNGKKDTVKVKVVNPFKPEGIELDRSGTVILSLYETLKLNAAMEPSTARGEITWSSSKKSRATVDANGVVKPVKEGTATITVKTYNGKKDTVKVKVVDPYKPTGIELDRSGTIELAAGSTLKLNTSLKPSTARATLTWKSSKTKVATVLADGTVTGITPGTATITVTTHNGKKDTVKIKVVKADVSSRLIELKPYALKVHSTVYANEYNYPYDSSLNASVSAAFSPVVPNLKAVIYDYTESDPYIDNIFVTCTAEAKGIHFVGYGSGGGFMLTGEAPYQICGLYPGMTISEAKQAVKDRSDLTAMSNPTTYNGVTSCYIETSLNITPKPIETDIRLYYDKSTGIVKRVFFEVFIGN